jgi:hypothetical protein
MASSLEKQITEFINHYASLFSSPDASSADRVANLCEQIGKCYRPGMTMFTNGEVARFEVRRRTHKYPHPVGT